MLYIGSDHNGFEKKEFLKGFLKSKNIPYVDVGNKKMVPADDYPIFAKKVAEAVSKKPAKNRGILLCSSGQGVCVVANKFKNVRAALAWNTKVAKSSRVDDDINVLCLPADFVSEQQAKKIMQTWLETKFSFEDRHIRRLQEITALEH